MKKILTLTALVSVLSSTSFAVRLPKNILRVQEASTVQTHFCQHLLNEAGQRPSLGSFRLTNDVDLAAGALVEFNPRDRDAGLYKVSITSAAEPLSCFILVDDALPSGFIQIFTENVGQPSAGVRFLFEENNNFPELAHSEGVELRQHAANGVVEMNSRADAFSLTIGGINLHFNRLANGQYALQRVEYTDGRETITPPQPIVAPVHAAGGAAAPQPINYDDDGDAVDANADPELAFALAMSRQAREEEAAFQRALEESQRDVAHTLGAADDDDAMFAALIALQAEANEANVVDVDGAVQDADDDDADEGLYGDDAELKAAIELSQSGVQKQETDEERRQREMRDVLRQAHEARLARARAAENK